MLKYGLKPKTPGRLIQECGSGLVSILSEGDKLFLTLPKPNVNTIPPERLEELTNALGVTSNHVKASATIDVGAVWMTLQLSNADEVRSLRPDMARLSALTPAGVTGVTVFGFTSSNTDSQVEVRSFAPSEGVAEDPVCGSGNGCVATLVRQLELIKEPNYVASQGYCVGRNGKVEVRFQENGDILLGGRAVTCIEGTVKVR